MVNQFSGVLSFNSFTVIIVRCPESLLIMLLLSSPFQTLEKNEPVLCVARLNMIEEGIEIVEGTLVSFTH